MGTKLLKLYMIITQKEKQLQQRMDTNMLCFYPYKSAACVYNQLRILYRIVPNILQQSSNKGIIIGKNGAVLKKIGETARYEIERLLNAKVNLKIWVKVRKEWRDNNLLLKELGYKKLK